MVFSAAARRAPRLLLSALCLGGLLAAAGCSVASPGSGTPSGAPTDAPSGTTAAPSSTTTEGPGSVTSGSTASSPQTGGEYTVESFRDRGAEVAGLVNARVRILERGEREREVSFLGVCSQPRFTAVVETPSRWVSEPALVQTTEGCIGDAAWSAGAVQGLFAGTVSVATADDGDLTFMQGGRVMVLRPLDGSGETASDAGHALIDYPSYATAEEVLRASSTSVVGRIVAARNVEGDLMAEPGATPNPHDPQPLVMTSTVYTVQVSRVLKGEVQSGGTLEFRILDGVVDVAGDGVRRGLAGIPVLTPGTGQDFLLSLSGEGEYLGPINMTEGVLELADGSLAPVTATTLSSGELAALARAAEEAEPVE